MEIVVLRLWRHLYAYMQHKIDQAYPVAVGRPNTPTPLGVYRIINKAGDPGGPYGSRWMGLSLSGYGIHGTDDPTSIGKSISMGCIRMYNQDINYLFNFVPADTMVRIIETPKYLPAGYQQPPGKPYQVKPNDTLYKLANQFNTTVRNIVSYNHLQYTEEQIYPGQMLVII